MDLLRELVRARALEETLNRFRKGPDGGPPRPRPVSPALPAARSLRRSDDGTGDVFSLRTGSPAAGLAMGLTPAEILRQARGTGSAPAAGRDAGGFPSDLARGLLAPFHLPGILVEVLAGVAHAFQLRGERRVALLVDDVASSGSGDWHEGLNFAAVRQAPMVLVVDAAGRGPMDAPVDSLGDRAPAYGFTAHQVPGDDPRAVERVVWTAVEAARTGGGLQVVQVESPARDPVEFLLEAAVTSEVLTGEAADAMVDEALAEMAGVLAQVEAEADPDPARDLVPGIHFPKHWSAP